MSKNFRLTANTYSVFFRFGLRFLCKVVLCFAVITSLLLLLNSGCRKRRPAIPAPDTKISEQFWIRVLLLDNIQQCSIKIDSSFSVQEEDFDLQTKKSKNNFKPINEYLSVRISGGQIDIAGRVYKSSRIIISPENSYIFSLNDKPYRGRISLKVNPDGNSFDVINLVPVESYIAGVAGAEMPDYWEPEALKCQVIAARTYCLFIKRHFGSSRAWDLNKTAAHQVYLGIEAESAAIWKAVNETSGMVLTCTQSDGTEDIFPAYYSSACGGHTENSEYVFGDSYEPLKGVECAYCKDVAKPEIFFWPDARFEKADVIKRLMNKYPNLSRLGEITEISVAQQSDYGEFSRLTKIEFLGSSGNREFLRAEDFRLTIDSSGRKLKSAACKFEETDDMLIFTQGRGWGHGVGMCQCGAEGMAREGKKAEDILQYYYPGSKILKLDYNK